MTLEIQKELEIICQAAIIKGDYKTPAKLDHKLHRQMSIAYNNLLTRGTEGEKAFKHLLKHENKHVRSWVAAQLLSKGEQEALVVLKELSNENGMIGFAAKMVIEEYNRNRLKSPFGELCG
jgi:hypothetical protein